jgi:hypothetical protein
MEKTELRMEGKGHEGMKEGRKVMSFMHPVEYPWSIGR